MLRIYIWSILTKRRQLVFSGGLHQTNATITSFEGVVGQMLMDSWKNFGTLTLKIENLTNGLK